MVNFQSLAILSLAIAAVQAGAPAAVQKQNAAKAKALNAQFAKLTANSACTGTQQACVKGSFAQCVGGKFQLSACSGGTQCFALPLVNSAGTSITCDTPADAQARINSAANAKRRSLERRAADAATQAANAADAQALNTKFQGLTADSACTGNEQACVAGSFAQCVGGKFQLSACSGGTQCFALPLVNSRGTSITCDVASDADRRIQAAAGNTGAAAPAAAAAAPAGDAAAAPAAAAPKKGKKGKNKKGKGKNKKGKGKNKKGKKVAA